MEPTLLTFRHLDDLLEASVRKGLDCSPYLASVMTRRIGPLVELLIYDRSKPVGFNALSATSELVALRGALKPGSSAGGTHGTNETHQGFGFVLTRRDPSAEDETQWASFCLKAQMSAERAGINKQTARGLVGVLRELEGNVHEHSRRSHDGIVGYMCSQGEFEFVIADSGIGTLNSLRENPKYAQLTDAGQALELTLTDGVSKFPDSAGRGYGFRELFIGIANLNGELRFRSGDHALTIDGTGPWLPKRLFQKPELQGFVASIVCRP